MPIGEALGYVPNPSGSRLRSFRRWLYRRSYLRFYGIADLHTHIRWRAVKPLVLSVCPTGEGIILDVGCGSGVMSFEIARQVAGARVVGVDIDCSAIAAASEIKDRAGAENVGFRVMSGAGLSGIPDKSCDVVLLIDVIEHIVDHEGAVREVGRVLKPGGALIVSVPTPNYPRIFGREFHDQIGHVRDGYSIEELRELLGQQRIRVEKYEHYTYPPSAFVCFFYYRWLRKLKYVSVLASPLLNLISYLDYGWPVRRPGSACAVALRARKEMA